MSDQSVRFEGGTPHGSWSWDEPGTDLTVVFHHASLKHRAVRHDFVKVADTATYVLVRTNGNIQPDAVLIAQNTTQGNSTPGGDLKRRRTT